MEIIYITILTFFAGMVGTMTGFGTSTIMVPVFLLFYSLPQTLLFVGIIHWFGDLWKILLFKKGLNWKLILGFGLSGIVASFIGAYLTFEISEQILKKVLGGFLLAYVIFLFFKPDFKLDKNKKNMITGGALSGFFAGIFGVGGAVRATFLTAFNLPKAMYIATAGSIALLIDTTRIITYLNGGERLESVLLWGMLVFIPVSFLSAKIAKRIISYIPQKSFRLFITIFLALIGLYFLILK
jgi:uncharacterized membrane protein YfcA